MSLKKGLIGLALIVPITSFGEVKVSKETITIVDPQAIANQVLNRIENQASSLLDEFLNSLGLPPLLKTPVSEIFRSLYSEILCRIPTPQFSPATIQIPDGINIPLSCSNIWISFDPFYKQALETADDLDGGTLKDMHRCLKGDLNACKEVAERNEVSTSKVVEAKKKNDVAYAKGLGYPPYEMEQRKKIEQNYTQTVNALSKPSVESSPKGVVINGVSEKARLNAERKAGKSTGELLNWGREDTQNMPKPVIPYYRYIADKQFTRNSVIQALQERIRQERRELARLQSAIRAYCDEEWNIKTIPPVRGGIGGLFGKERVKNIYTDLLSPQRINVVQYVKNEILARVNKNQPVVRGCCCCDAIPAIESARDSVNAHIETAKREIEATIERVGNMIADVISQEEYRTRQQINADSQAISDNIKKTLCFKAQLDFQRNKLQLLQLEVEVAKLQALYSILNKEEMKEYKEKLKTLRKIY